MNRIKFKINGIEHSVGSEVSSDLTLVEYIRNSAELRGTKYMCFEGGCGACIVSVVIRECDKTLAVNSCLVCVLSCQDWEITTIEGIGNKLDGYNKIQTTLAAHNGTQCGYCSPGFVMSMYSNLENKDELTMLEIEKSFGSNVCRCTGYRPILEAFKTFGSDAPKNVNFNITDIEELSICKGKGQVCPKRDSCSEEWCFVSQSSLRMSGIDEICLSDGKKWIRTETLTEIFFVLEANGCNPYMLINGNTGRGAIPIEEFPATLIDISKIPELKGYKMEQNLVIGAGTTLTEAIEIFKTLSVGDFIYLEEFRYHFELIAHIPVRNLGTIGGNLMLKYKEHKFPSDVFLLFEAVGAQLTIMGPIQNKTREVTMQEFLRMDMTSKIIFNVMLPPLSSKHKLVTFKVMPRAQAVHAIVHAAFLYELDSGDAVKDCRIVYGGLSPTFARASFTEKCLKGKHLFSNKTLRQAILVLENELKVTENPPEPSVKYRRRLAVNLFYKSLLHLCPKNKLDNKYQSGGAKIHASRPVSSSSQTYDTDPSLWPLNQNIQKLEGLIQCTGEAEYVEDHPKIPREVFAAFVLSTVGTGIIASTDATKALEQPGVIAFYTAKDIPGINSFTPKGSPFSPEDEEALSSGEIKYYHQPIGIIAAETKVIAQRAAKLVKVTYSNVNVTPATDIKKVKTDSSKLTLFKEINATEKGTDVTKVIKGENTIYSQYHFTMETLVCVTKPIEQCIEVYAATQWLDAVQLMVARALDVDENRIDVSVRRLGGAYGIKISRATQIAVACSLVSMKLNRPCRFIQSLSDNMQAIGKRFPCSSNFEAGINDSGEIQYLNYELYEDNGYTINEPLSLLGVEVYNNCYNAATWNYKCYNAITDNAKNTFCRAPGTLENIAMTEYIMERIAYQLKLDPLEVRLANVDTAKYSAVKEMSETLKKKANYSERRIAVDKFNSRNRWTKRGLRFSFLRWITKGSVYWDSTISVYHGDGTVAITHGGIEMGQGINTKAAQIAAYILKIPLNMIQIKRSDSMIAPNSFISGGSVASQYVGIGVQKCCEGLLKKLEPIRQKMTNPSWKELIQKAFESDVDLQTHAYVGAADEINAELFGVALAEVKVDILTGESEILKVDLIQDVGRSVSPGIDIGQVEGAFIMGLGYWTSERLVFESTGKLLTKRAWDYHVPQARDIPQDFNVYFRHNSFSDAALLGAKATGEPPICLSICIPFAIREAISASRSDSGIPSTEWFEIDGPYTLEKICMAASTRIEDYKFI